MEQVKPSILKNGIIYAAALQIVFLLFAYVMGPEMFGSFILSLVKFLAITSLLLFLALEIRKNNFGFIEFGALFKQLFFISLGMCIAVDAVGLILFQVIDPGFIDEIKQMQMNEMYKRFESANMPQEQIDDSIAKAQEYMDKPWYINFAFSFFGGIIWWTIISLILAAIFKKKEALI